MFCLYRRLLFCKLNLGIKGTFTSTWGCWNIDAFFFDLIFMLCFDYRLCDRALHWFALSFALGIYSLHLFLQRLEFVMETRIVAEMKIKNCGTNYVPWGKNWQAYFFFYEQNYGGSVHANWRWKTDFHYEFQCSRFLQICLQNASNCTDCGLDFQIFPGEHASTSPHIPLDILSYFSLAIPGSVLNGHTFYADNPGWVTYWSQYPSLWTWSQTRSTFLPGLKFCTHVVSDLKELELCAWCENLIFTFCFCTFFLSSLFCFCFVLFHGKTAELGILGHGIFCIYSFPLIFHKRNPYLLSWTFFH